MNPLVSVIIPVHGRGQQALACVGAAAGSDYENFEIVVVDNCSPDDTPQRIAAAFPAVRVIRLPDNFGAGGGRNEGMRRARGEYFFFVDSDVVVERNTLKILVEAVIADPTIGAVGPVIYYSSNRKPYFVRTRIDLRTSRTYYDRDIPGGKTTLETHHIPCAWLVSRAVVEKVGMMDPIYRTYYDESDWHGRMGRAGYRHLVCLNAAAGHDVPYNPAETEIIAEMTAGDPPKALYHLYHLARNRTIFMKKFAGKFHYRLFLAYYNQLFLFYYLYRLISRSGLVFARAYLRGYGRGLLDARRVKKITDGTEDRHRLPLIPLTRGL